MWKQGTELCEKENSVLSNTLAFLIVRSIIQNRNPGKDLHEKKLGFEKKIHTDPGLEGSENGLQQDMERRHRAERAEMAPHVTVAQLLRNTDWATLSLGNHYL